MSNNKALSCFGGAILMAVIVVIASVFHGWVLTILWGWFIVPLFGLPHLGIGYAIGLSLIVSSMTSKTDPDKKESKGTVEQLVDGLLTVLISGLLTLLMGWIIYSLI